MKTRSSYLSDYLIAFAVIVCTLALLAGLAVVLTGFRWQKAGRTIEVDFPDVAGIHRHSQVRYAGAPAGAVIGLRHLTREERLASANPRNAVRVTLSLRDDVPPIPQDVTAALGSDTLLSEKFIALDAGTAGAPPLADGAIIQGQPTPTFDDLIRSGGLLVSALQEMLPEVKTQLSNLLPKIAAISDAGKKLAEDGHGLLAKADTLIENLNALTRSGTDFVGDAKKLVTKTSDIIETNEAALEKSIQELPGVLDRLDALLARSQSLLSSNEKDLSATIRDLRLVMQDMRVAAVHTKTLMRTLAGGRPTRLIWTTNVDRAPTDEEILKSSRQPAPARIEPAQTKSQKPGAATGSRDAPRKSR